MRVFYSKLVYTVASIDTQCIDSNLESGRYISRVGWAKEASRFLSSPSRGLGASIHQMLFYSRMYLNLLIGRVVHKTSDRLHDLPSKN